MGQWITTDDLTVFVADIDPAKAEQMIADAEAMALMAAPCLADVSGDLATAAIKAVLRQALLRWDQSGVGALSQRSESTGAFSVSESYDTRQSRRAMFWPSEIADLQKVCGAPESVAAGGVSMIARTGDGLLEDRPDLWFQYMWPAPKFDLAERGW